MPCAFRQMVEAREVAERYFQDVCDLEFSVQDGQLYILQARRAKRSSIANLRFALQFLVEGKIGPQDVLRRVSPPDIAAWLLPVIENGSALRLVGKGLPTSGGVATGTVVFRASEAADCAAKKIPVILVRNEVSPSDLHGMGCSEGILTMRGGICSHAALVSRQIGKPCVCGYSPKHALTEKDRDIHSLFQAGSWITINGLTGEVFEGRGKCKTLHWRDYPELTALAEIVARAVSSGNTPRDAVGQTWRMNDFFFHAAPLTRGSIGKRAVSRSSFTSFEQPSGESLDRIRQSLTPLAREERRNYSEILLSLMDSQLRIFFSALGVGNHPQYFRPLWNPKQSIYRKDEEEGTQLVGMEFFGINRHVPHLVDVATITILLELDARGEGSEWFLDFTNPAGESLVVGSESVHAYRLLINDAEVQHDDVPLLYDSLRRREYRWRIFDQNGTTHGEVVNALAGWVSKKSVDARALPLCYELGLLRDRKLTLAGESLLGKLHRNKQYEFAKTNPTPR